MINKSDLEEMMKVVTMQEIENFIREIPGEVKTWWPYKKFNEIFVNLKLVPEEYAEGRILQLTLGDIKGEGTKTAILYALGDGELCCIK